MKKTTKISKPSRPVKPAPVVVSPWLPFILAISLLMIGSVTALTYVRNSIYKTHVSLWAEVVRTAPNKRRAHENYGQALSTAGMLNEALREFKTVIALRDDGSVPLRDLYREIGVVYFRMGLYEDSIVAWQTGLRHAPYDPSLLNNLSIVLLQTGKYDEAANAAQQALMGDPLMPQALNTMGQIHLVKRDYQKAVQYFVKALDREPDVPARYWNIALAYEQAGNLAKSWEFANRYAAMERDPGGRQRALAYIEHLKQVMAR